MQVCSVLISQQMIAATLMSIVHNIYTEQSGSRAGFTSCTITALTPLKQHTMYTNTTKAIPHHVNTIPHHVNTIPHHVNTISHHVN